MASDDEELSALIRRSATRYRASEQLRANVRTQVALAAAGREQPRRLLMRWRDLGWRAAVDALSLRWRTASIGFVLGVAATLFLGQIWRASDFGNSLESELVADHVRALKVGPLTEVASSDRHTVKPWFQGRIDYAPPVFDLQEEGFPLIGGRLEHVRGRAIAALTYMSHRHVMNVFVWPADVRQAPQRQVSRGFNVVHWADASMQYWIVSDVEAAEIERFVQAWQARAAAQ